MKLEDLQMLSALFQTKNMTQAAKQLYISQPALTIRLQNMERELNCQIAVRSNKGLIFTPEGEYLAKRAIKISALMEQTLKHIKTMQGQSLGTLKLAAPSTFSRYFLLGLLQDYKQISPGTNFQLEVSDSDQIVKKINALEAYCGFVHGDYLDPLPKFKVASMPAYAISKEPLTMEQLPSMPFITHNTTEKTQGMIQEWWKERFHGGLEAQMNVKNIDVCLHMVESGLGIGIVFGDFWAQEHKLCKLPLQWADGTPLTRNIWFLYAEEMEASPCLVHFIQFLKEKVPLD